MTIVGDAGVGKTGLVRELWQQLADQKPEPLRRTGRCLSYGTGTAYWALGEVLKEHLGLLESDAPEVALDRLGARDILGLTLGLDVARDVHPLVARDRFHDRLGGVLERCRRRTAAGCARGGHPLGRGPAPGLARVRVRHRARAAARDRDRAPRTSRAPPGLGRPRRR